MGDGWYKQCLLSIALWLFMHYIKCLLVRLVRSRECRFWFGRILYLFQFNSQSASNVDFDKSAVSTFYSHAYFSTTTNSYTRREHLSICNGSSNSNSSSGTGTYRLSMLTSNSTSNKFFLVFLLIKTHHALDIHGICTEGDGKKDLDVVYINSH